MPRHQILGEPAGQFAGFQLSGDRGTQARVHRGVSGKELGRGCPDNVLAALRVPHCGKLLSHKSIRSVAGVNQADAPAVWRPDALAHEAPIAVVRISPVRVRGSGYAKPDGSADEGAEAKSTMMEAAAETAAMEPTME